jgi:hypothetical protein
MRARHPHERHDFFQQTRCGHASPPLSPSVRNALKILKPATVMTAAAPIAPYNPLLRGLLEIRLARLRGGAVPSEVGCTQVFGADFFGPFTQ